MNKSPKSRCCKGRCCKVDVVKVKGCPEAVCLILVCTLFPTTQGLYLCPGEKPDSKTITTRLLASKDKNY
jgi:hypothetical protein